jgi:hypothetical protein
MLQGGSRRHVRKSASMFCEGPLPGGPLLFLVMMFSFVFSGWTLVVVDGLHEQQSP